MSEPTFCDVNCGETHQAGCPEKNKEIFSKVEESRELIEMCGRLQTSLSQEQARGRKYREALKSIVILKDDLASDIAEEALAETGDWQVTITDFKHSDACWCNGTKDKI